MRLQKFLADAGVASRRASEQIILAGRVLVNGHLVRELGTKTDPARDSVVVDGRPIKTKRKIYIALNKPRGYLCARLDKTDRKLITELLPLEWSHLFSVGRLDLDSDGLIFLTNDGEFSLRLTHPRYGVSKTYRVAVAGKVDSASLQKILRGIEDRGETLRAQKARILSANNTESVVELELAEGKNREVRRLFEAQGIAVNRLQRIKIGKIKLGELPIGKWRTLTEPEIKSLLPKL
ncbi:MAG: rRNA pseudouridine synthase [Verrucomicrobiota bacterium]|nr:rRNA pseudouridine synthase [Verrucomicrobiota bacterium]